MPVPKVFAPLFVAALCATALLAGDAPLKDGVYKGSAKGYLGPVEVEVTVKDSKIEEVKIVKSVDDRPKNALVEIPKRIVAAQSAKVDAVTGATFTSKGVCKAVEAALNGNAGKAACAGCCGKGGK